MSDRRESSAYQVNDSTVARVPNRLAIAFSVSVVAHACLISLVGVQPQYPWAQAPGAIEVRIVPVTAASVGHTEPAVEAIESAPIAYSDAVPPTNGETDARPPSRLQASHVEQARATNQRQAVEAPVPMMEELPIATLQASPPSGSIYYADSEVDAMAVALDPIVPRYPSGSDAATDGGKVMLRLLSRPCRIHLNTASGQFGRFGDGLRFGGRTDFIAFDRTGIACNAQARHAITADRA